MPLPAISKTTRSKSSCPAMRISVTANCAGASKRSVFGAPLVSPRAVKPAGAECSGCGEAGVRGVSAPSEPAPAFWAFPEAPVCAGCEFTESLSGRCPPNPIPATFVPESVHAPNNRQLATAVAKPGTYRFRETIFITVVAHNTGGQDNQRTKAKR